DGAGPNAPTPVPSSCPLKGLAVRGTLGVRGTSGPCGQATCWVRETGPFVVRSGGSPSLSLPGLAQLAARHRVGRNVTPVASPDGSRREHGTPIIRRHAWAERLCRQRGDRTRRTSLIWPSP